MRALVNECAGFIGSHDIAARLGGRCERFTSDEVLVLGPLAWASTLTKGILVRDASRLQHVHADAPDPPHSDDLVAGGVAAHLAAQSHVRRFIPGAAECVLSTVGGGELTDRAFTRRREAVCVGQERVLNGEKRKASHRHYPEDITKTSSQFGHAPQAPSEPSLADGVESRSRGCGWRQPLEPRRALH